VSLKQKVTEAAKKVGFFRGVKKVANNRKAKFLKKVREATNRINHHTRWLENVPGNPDASPGRIRYHERQRLAAHRRRTRAHKKLTAWRKRHRWAKNREDFWKELLESRKRRLRNATIGVSDFKNSMTGRHEWWTLTPAAKAVVAIGVLQFRLWVSSTYRPETPGSHHAEDPTRGADLAGEWDDMVAFQKWLYTHHRKALLELFGPDNYMAVKNGKPIGPLAEGSFLEDLHDTHVHVFLINPNYKVTYER
jgi:hypothetical protein